MVYYLNFRSQKAFLLKKIRGKQPPKKLSLRRNTKINAHDDQERCFLW